MLKITDFSDEQKRKKTILMVGRLHPGETHSSWLIHGFIRFLLSESPKARELRSRIIFKIVPMLNPDGVIIGNYRCTLCGFDMNRNFGGDTAAAALRLNPETNTFKAMAK
jgi:murein tripeptide amidase MpaA